jgi:hypothetical protein
VKWLFDLHNFILLVYLYFGKVKRRSFLETGKYNRYFISFFHLRYGGFFVARDNKEVICDCFD